MLSVDDVGIVTYLDVAAETSMGMTRATGATRVSVGRYQGFDVAMWRMASCRRGEATKCRTAMCTRAQTPRLELS